MRLKHLFGHGRRIFSAKRRNISQLLTRGAQLNGKIESLISKRIASLTAVSRTRYYDGNQSVRAIIG
jgi:hypothetical protein